MGLNQVFKLRGNIFCSFQDLPYLASSFENTRKNGAFIKTIIPRGESGVGWGERGVGRGERGVGRGERGNCLIKNRISPSNRFAEKIAVQNHWISFLCQLLSNRKSLQMKLRLYYPLGVLSLHILILFTNGDYPNPIRKRSN